MKILVLIPIAFLSGGWARADEPRNPFSSQDVAAIQAGSQAFARNCASCHGANANGSGNVPSLAHGRAQTMPEPDIFRFIEKGSPLNGMPPFGSLPERQRWQIVTFLKNMPKSGAVPPPDEARTDTSAPPPPAPFTDYRYERPGLSHRILARDLPAPAPETSVGNAPRVVPRPEGAWPKVPPGFRVELFASGRNNPRLLRTAPNGDVFVAESGPGRILVFRGRKQEEFAKGLNRPYGIAFYPPGAKPQWVYVGNTDSIVRFPYAAGDLHARGPAQKIADLPSSDRGHWTRDVEFSLDGRTLFVGVGSASNVDDPDTTPAERNRADILAMNPEDGSRPRVYASGIRNAGGGMAVNPDTGELWCSVNERDGLGDNLVPDYITRVREGGFYGWPWWYMGRRQDPRHPGARPDLKDKFLEPDILLQPHNASLELVFYSGRQFPAEYRGDIFASQHGSWNRSVRTGYELIRVPLRGKARATGEYEDFMTGFVVDAAHVWGRPVGVTVAADGSLLVSDDGSNSIWRVSYAGGPADR